jgi:hypothetical protein
LKSFVSTFWPRDLTSKVRAITQQETKRALRALRSAVDYGLYALVDVETGGAVNPAVAQRWVCSWTIDQVQDYLSIPAAALKGKGK